VITEDLTEVFNEQAIAVIKFTDQYVKDHLYEYVGAEHLLLGIMNGDHTDAYMILNNSLPSIASTKRTLEERMPPTNKDHTSLGKRPNSPSTKAVIEHAREIADKHGYHKVGTAHILIGLLKVPSIAKNLLEEEKLTYALVKKEMHRTKNEFSITRHYDITRWSTPFLHITFVISIIMLVLNNCG